jgi:hypothetical protein
VQERSLAECWRRQAEVAEDSINSLLLEVGDQSDYLSTSAFAGRQNEIRVQYERAGTSCTGLPADRTLLESFFSADARAIIAPHEISGC